MDTATVITEAEVELARIAVVAAKGGAFKRSASAMEDRLMRKVRAHYMAAVPGAVAYTTLAYMLRELRRVSA